MIYHDDYDNHYAFGGRIGSYLKNKFSDLGNYIKSNPGKILAGAATAGLGAYAAHKGNQMANQYYNNIDPHQMANPHPDYSNPDYNRNISRPMQFQDPAYSLDKWREKHDLMPYGAPPVINPEMQQINRQNSSQGPAGGIGVMLHGTGTQNFKRGGGILKRVGRQFVRSAHDVGNFARKQAPIILGAAGTVLGGPLGGTVGGALGQNVKKGFHHPLKDAVNGGLKGLLTSLAIGGTQALIAGAGGGGGGGLASILGGGSSNSSIPGLLRGLAGGAGNAANTIGGSLQGVGNGLGNGIGGLGSLLGGEGGGINPVQLGLLGLMLNGAIRGRERTEQPQEESLEQHMNRHGMHRRSEGFYRRVKPLDPQEEVYSQPQEFDVNKPYYTRKYYKEANPPTEHFATGGYVKGASGGQTDDRKTFIPNGSYVWDATTVSLLGDGNSDHGALKVKNLEDKFLTSGVTKDLGHSHNENFYGTGIKAKVSDGEYIMSPEAVTALGKGNNKNGAKVIDKMRNNLRKQKGVKKFLPPKSKPIEHYMGRR